MPFTFSHPAFILPLAKNKKLPLQALVIGSMVPDFEFYFQLREVDHIGHNFLGFFVFDLPMGLMVLYLYNNFVSRYLRTIAPNTILWKCNTIAYKHSSYKKNGFSINNLVALTIGILSHLILDLFTHHYSFINQYIPQLNYSVLLFGFSIKVHVVNQIFLSISGLIALSFVFFNTKPTATNKIELNISNLLSFILIGFTILFCRLYFFNEYNNFWSIIVAIIGSLLYSLIINSVFYIIKSNNQYHRQFTKYHKS